MLPHTRKVFMQNITHVFEIAIAILKLKITVKFHSQTITNFVWTLIVWNTQGCTSALFKDHPISFLVYSEGWSSKLLHTDGTYLPIYTVSYPRRRKYHSSRSLKKFCGVLSRTWRTSKSHSSVGVYATWRDQKLVNLAGGTQCLTFASIMKMASMETQVSLDKQLYLPFRIQTF